MMRRTRARRSPERGPLGGALALLLGAAFLLGGCDVEILGGGGGGEVIEDRFSLTVTVTNVGNGFGRVEVDFPSGTVRDPCTEVLGPGESCSPSVVGPTMIQTAEIGVSAEPGSRFVEWTGVHCSGTSTECTVQNQSGEFDVQIAVEPRFDLLEGG